MVGITVQITLYNSFLVIFGSNMSIIYKIWPKLNTRGDFFPNFFIAFYYFYCFFNFFITFLLLLLFFDYFLYFFNYFSLIFFFDHFYHFLDTQNTHNITSPISIINQTIRYNMGLLSCRVTTIYHPILGHFLSAKVV